MRKTRRVVNPISAILLLTLMVIGLFLGLDNFTKRSTGTSAYPPPVIDNTSWKIKTSYPGPIQWNTPDNSNTTPVLNPEILVPDPDLTTEIANKLQYTPSNEELSIMATDTYLQFHISTLATPAPTAVPDRYPVSSVEDIVKVVLNDPFFEDVNQGDFGPCLRANTPGEAVFVRSLQAGWLDYYLVPFYLNDKVCGVYKVVVQEGMGTVSGWGGGFGKQFPPVGADQARILVEEKTGQKVIKGPELVFRLLLEPVGPLSPFWLVVTADGQSYFVIYRPGQGPDDIEVNLYNSVEVHTVGP